MSTAVAKTKAKSTKKSASPRETDNFYFLKILVYFVVGALWIKVNGAPILPLGLILGILLAQHDRFIIDRKIEYAILLISALLNLTLANLFISVWI